MRPNKRDEILEGARRCFYNHGIAATGVDAIAEEAGVSKRTLYNHFPSKDDLVHAYIRWRDEEWRKILAHHMDGVDEPMDRLLAYVDAYLDDSFDPEYRGCPLVNAATEVVDDSPTLAVIAETKERARVDIQGLLTDLGHPTPEETSVAVMALLEGACALGGVQRERLDDGPLVRAIHQLADPATVSR